MTRRSRNRKQSRTSDQPAEPAHTSNNSPAPVDSKAGTRFGADRTMPVVLGGVLACFFLSGFAALLYQTAWLRQFSLIFGTSDLAVATVLAAYMGGLAAGAAVAARYIAKVVRPILVYGFLEAGIALSALAVPLLLAGAGTLYAWTLGGQPEPPQAATLGQPVFYLVVGFIVLAVPTGFMGATLPLLTRYIVHSNQELGPKVAILYATNTAGAVFGTVTAAFLLLPELGLKATVWVGVVVNVLVFVIAAMLARRTSDRRQVEPSRSDVMLEANGFIANCIKPLLHSTEPLGLRLQAVFQRQVVWILPLMLVSGANAFLYEVLWTRMLSHVLGGTVYAFATMLAAFLTGIALGSAMAATLAERRERAAVAFAVTQAAIAVLSAGVYVWMQTLIPGIRGTAQFAIYAAAVMLPATLFIGATFPLAVRMLARNEAEVGNSTARVYAWNTVGAIAGAILAGFWLIPALGFEGSIKLAVLINLGIVVWATVCILPTTVLSRLTAAAALLLTLILYHPARPQAVIASTGFDIPDAATSSELYFAVGRSATVLLTETDGRFDLRTNGLPEASVLTKGAPPLGQVQHWLPALPLAARPDARTMMVIGFGGGVALEGLPASIRAIDVIELEPEVVNAVQRLSGLRAVDPLADSRINVIINDARNAMRLTDKHYDIIVSQPSHPWTAGASHLFTEEFLTQAKTHLNEGGVFLQWMSAGFVDAALLRSLTATLSAVFGNVRLYYGGASVLFFLASDEPLDIELQILNTGQPLTQNLLHYSYMGLNAVDDFVAALLLDEAGAQRFAAAAPPSTDDKNLMATHSRSLSDGLDPAELMELLAPYDPLLNNTSFIYQRLSNELNFAYIAARLLADGQTNRASQLAATVPDESTRQLITGLVLGSSGQVDGVREAFLSALRADPNNADAQFALLEPVLPALATGQATDDANELARNMTGPVAAVVRGWRLAASQDWQGLANLERELARTNVTDLWFPEATQLRADWRTQVVDESRYANDALRMIDRALLLRPDVDLYILRAAAADILNDDDAFIETTRYAVEHIKDRLDAFESGRAITSKVELDITFQHLSGLRVKLSQLANDARPRVGLIADDIGEALRRIQVLARAPQR